MFPFLPMSKTCPGDGKTRRISTGRVGRGVGQRSRHSAASINKGATTRCWASCFSKLPKVPRKKKNQGNSSANGFIPRRLSSVKVNGFVRGPVLLNRSLYQGDVDLLSMVQAVDRRASNQAQHLQ